MSRSMILKTSLFSVIGLGLGAGMMSLYSPAKNISPGRQVASLNEKMAPPLMMGKHLSVVQVAVQAPEGIAENEGQETMLVGWVRLNQPVDQDVNFRWELPDGVQVVEGQLENVWNGMKAGETAETRLKVTGFSKESMKLVVLQGFIKDADTEFGSSGALTSRPEDSYEMLTASASSNDSSKQKASASGGSELREEARQLLTGKILR